ncbi:hypothetical protein E2562_032412 [Oryza meyeriana var. granulata]|uniref:Uncharacterized protein n=1 Tax=Oryza meyeriana var. granulata TaxID=110450 RepID=A0A6G1CVL3_9ORYZ|nr:hypothetical protein E2562_032412 [Oryza meyeriana var. granulata]
MVVASGYGCVCGDGEEGWWWLVEQWPVGVAAHAEAKRGAAAVVHGKVVMVAVHGGDEERRRQRSWQRSSLSPPIPYRVPCPFLS